MTICSPEAGDIARGRSPRAILPVEGEQIVMSPSLKGNNCFIIPNPFLKQISDTTGQTQVTTSAPAHLGEYDIRG